MAIIVPTDFRTSGSRADMDLSAPKVVRGRLTNLRTADYFEFSINPSHVSKKGGANITDDPIPGFSDPLLRFGSGKVKTFSFTLQLDGEVTRRRKTIQFPNDLHYERSILATFSIAGELEFLESLTAPTDPNEPGADGGLDRVVFSFGEYVKGAVCFVESADADITQWAPDLAPVVASVSMVLKRVQDTNEYSNQIWTRVK